ncbi:hypothetical protein QTI66_14600 [Variovorax sp. J22R133]|uniref:hypothetical protein n=1 Tax=Variovorax brevis TaxID=3053503 RepID=UPI002575A836|nr:hypothetical protein [Variovorax sp. J22R133]MDM0113385.1 hypothetical protein [Variovorax sp. J22R133]
MPAEDDASSLPHGRFEGPQAFRELVLSALEAAAREGWREIVLSDPDYVDWPLGDRATADALQQWSAAGRSMVMLAERFDVFERYHARFVTWRRMWGHIVDCRVCRGSGMPQVPSGIWTPAWFARRMDVENYKGMSGNDGVSRRALREAIDECLRHSRAGFPTSTLGL